MEKYLSVVLYLVVSVISFFVKLKYLCNLLEKFFGLRVRLIYLKDDCKDTFSTFSCVKTVENTMISLTVKLCVLMLIK